MGAAMAARWVGAGFDVTVWNRDPAKARAIDGATVAPSPAAAVDGASIVVTMLADGAATESVMTDALPAMAPGAVWIQMATVGLDAHDRLASMAHRAGVALVDAPVSGTKAPAEQGTLAVLASGPEELRARCGPVFDAVASSVTWVGEAGAGQRLKLVVNHWLAALLAGLAESIALAEHLGIDPAEFLRLTDGAAIGSPYAQLKGSMMLDRSYPASFPLRLLAKDVGLVSDAARATGADLRLPGAVGELLGAALAEHGDDDMSAVVEALRDDRHEVVDDRVNQRFVLRRTGAAGELCYRLDGERLVLEHTRVPEPLRGQGIGGRLLRAAVDHAAAAGLTVVPVCTYARRWLEEHPDEARRVPIEWPEQAPSRTPGAHSS